LVYFLHDLYLFIYIPQSASAKRAGCSCAMDEV
jgi:hypothetical protein